MTYMTDSHSQQLDGSELVSKAVLDAVASASNQSLVAVPPLQESVEPSAVVCSSDSTSRFSHTGTPLQELNSSITDGIS